MTEYIYDYTNPSFCGLIYTATHPDTDKQFDYFGETEKTFSKRMSGYKTLSENQTRPIAEAMLLYAKENTNDSLLSTYNAFQFTPFCSLWVPDTNTKDLTKLRRELEFDLICSYQTKEIDGGLNFYKRPPKERADRKPKKKYKSTGTKVYNDGKNRIFCHDNDPRIENLDLVLGAPKTSKHYYNDGKTDYLLEENDKIIEKENLVKGRRSARSDAFDHINDSSIKKKWYNDGKKEYYRDVALDNSHLVEGRLMCLKWFNDGKNNFKLSLDDPKAKTLKRGRIYKPNLPKNAHWYNDGVRNYVLSDGDSRIKDLTKGRKKDA